MRIIITLLGLFLTIPAPNNSGMSLWFWMLEQVMGKTISIKEGYGSVLFIVMLALPILISYLYLYSILNPDKKIRRSLQALGITFLWYTFVMITYRITPFMNGIIWVFILFFEIYKNYISKKLKKYIGV